MSPREIRPHPGPQTQFFETDADIIVFGGAAGPGKTFCLLIEPLRYIHKQGYNAVIFRRDREQVRQSGGLWDESQQWYAGLGAKGREQQLDWRFPTGASITFDGILHEQDKLKYQGAQICYIGWDELTHFTESQFWYLQSRNRSLCGVRPYMRATLNPDPDSWVYSNLIGPWVNHDFIQDGERFTAESGEVLWFRRLDDGRLWYRREKFEGAQSLSFIAARHDANPTLLEKDPGYLDRLGNLPEIDRRRLLEGDWSAVGAGGLINPDKWTWVPSLPEPCYIFCRGWDTGLTEGGDESAGILVGLGASSGIMYVMVDQIWCGAVAPSVLKVAIKDRAEADPGQTCLVAVERSTASLSLIDDLAQDPFYTHPRSLVQVPTRGRDKWQRATGWVARAEEGRIKFVGDPTSAHARRFAGECRRFTIDRRAPGYSTQKDNQIDGMSVAFEALRDYRDTTYRAPEYDVIPGSDEYYAKLAGVDPYDED